MQNRESTVFRVNTWYRTENPRAMCVFVSPVLNPSSTNCRLDSFATYVYSCCTCLLDFYIIMIIYDISKQIKKRARIGKIFACWHLQDSYKKYIKRCLFHTHILWKEGNDLSTYSIQSFCNLSLQDNNKTSTLTQLGQSNTMEALKSRHPRDAKNMSKTRAGHLRECKNTDIIWE